VLVLNAIFVVGEYSMRVAMTFLKNRMAVGLPWIPNPVEILGSGHSILKNEEKIRAHR
jgi:hypothetical protein